MVFLLKIDVQAGAYKIRKRSSYDDDFARAVDLMNITVYTALRLHQDE